MSNPKRKLYHKERDAMIKIEDTPLFNLRTLLSFNCFIRQRRAFLLHKEEGSP